MTGEPEPTSRRRGPGQLVVFLLIAVALVGGVVLVVKGSQSHKPPAAPMPSATFAMPPGELPPVDLPPVTAGGAPTVAEGQCPVLVAPAHLVVASVCINGPVVPTAVEPDGALIIPKDVHQIGMWDKGAQLVGPARQPITGGTTLLAGHVNDVDQGDGTLHDLYKVEPGAVVYVADPAGAVTRWRVVGLDVVVKAALPKWLFAGPEGPRKLALVTCGGPIEKIPGVGNIYRDNVIVTAVPA